MTSSDDGTWEIHDEELPFASAVYGFGDQRVRMGVLGLGGGKLLVVSPGNLSTEASWRRLERWGEPRFLLAPNHFHHAGIRAWKERHPQATVVAHPRAHARLRKKLPGIAIEDLAQLHLALPEGMRVFSAPMAKQGETWVSARTKEGNGWFVTDGIVNNEGKLPGGLMGLVLRLFGFRPELMINPMFKRLFISDKAEFKAWLHAELERDRPVLFVPSHGVPLRGPDVSRRLGAVTDEA